VAIGVICRAPLFRAVNSVRKGGAKATAGEQTRRRLVFTGVTLLVAGLSRVSYAAQPTDTTNAPPLRPDGHRLKVDPTIAPFEPQPYLTGELHIVGGGGGLLPYIPEVIAQWVEIFQKAHPLVKIYNATSYNSSGTTPTSLAEDYAEVGVMSRDVTPWEAGLFRSKPFKLTEITVAGAAFNSVGITRKQSVWVHKDNPLVKLSLDRFDAIVTKTRKRGYREAITRWGQLGLTGEWADKPIHVYGNVGQDLEPNLRAPFAMFDGNPYYLVVNALKGGEFRDDIRVLDKPDAMAGDRYALGFGRHDDYEGVKTLALAETDAGPYYAGTYEEVLNRTYPLSRYVSLFLNEYHDRKYKDFRFNPLALEFIKVALSREGQEAVAKGVLMPLPAKTVQESLNKLR
jgi:phosphate transport system substrate-binding protein